MADYKPYHIWSGSIIPYIKQPTRVKWNDHCWCFFRFQPFNSGWGEAFFRKGRLRLMGSMNKIDKRHDSMYCTVPVFHGHLCSVLGYLQVLSEVVRDSVMAVFAVYIYIYMYTCVAITQSLYFYRTSFFLVGIMLLSLHKWVEFSTICKLLSVKLYY